MYPFRKYRPAFHFIAPHSWMNDPCGAMWVPETKEYILCYQWNPGTAEGGNCAWGMARSKDLITWQDCFPAIENGIDTKYDSKGVFSGSIASRIVDGHRWLYLFYTSVSALPIHWSKPYLKGSESQSVAVSTDYGNSWHRYQQNPLLSEPRLKSQTTGWRDPFVSEWKSLSALRGVSPWTSYMMLSSGKRGRGPELVLYESMDLLEWRFVSVLFKGKADTAITPDSPHHYGRNFECASFFTLNNRDYIMMGVEQHPSLTTRHSSRYTLWLNGHLSLTSKSTPTFTPTSHGTLDHGIYYASHLFRGPKSELLLSGWADEDCNSLASSQGWAGLITLPRNLYELSVPIPSSPLRPEEAHMWTHNFGSGTMSTLGIRPASQLRGLRSGSMVYYSLEALKTLRSKSYEIEARFRNLPATSPVTATSNSDLIFNVRQAPQDREVTRIIISPSSNTITVDRSSSSLGNGNLEPEIGYFRRFDGEDLHIRIFVDNSIVEVYANDRFALSSRIYPTLDSAVGASCNFGPGWVGGRGGAGESVVFSAWEGLVDAWPGRGRSANLSGEDGEVDFGVEMAIGKGRDMQLDMEMEGKMGEMGVEMAEMCMQA
jgi:beta-fructofuranosidase